jgi:hypothetical protein
MNISKRKGADRQLIFVLLLLIAVTTYGCDRSWWTRSEKAGSTLTAISYNYTGWEIRQVLFSDAQVKFDARSAAPGGSPFFRFGSTEPMDNGGQVWIGERACCFVWNTVEKATRIRVLWHVVFDPPTYEAFVKLNDERGSREGPPGSVWCQAIVELQKPYPLHPEALFLHILADGTVLADLAGAGTMRSGHALPSSLVKSHNRLDDGMHCPTVVDNPWYGVPREPHKE